MINLFKILKNEKLNYKLMGMRSEQLQKPRFRSSYLQEIVFNCYCCYRFYSLCKHAKLYFHLKVNFSSFALLFAEMIRYANNRSNTVTDLQDKLVSLYHLLLFVKFFLDEIGLINFCEGVYCII